MNFLAHTMRNLQLFMQQEHRAIADAAVSFHFFAFLEQMLYQTLYPVSTSCMRAYSSYISHISPPAAFYSARLSAARACGA
jgi:hypothetical protein